MPSGAPDFAQLKVGMKAAWMAGDFGQIAAFSAKAAEEFVARTPITPGTRVLDVACGTGNTAMPAARAGGVVTGIDIAPNLLEQARKRASAEQLAIEFQEGDAEQLPYPSSSQRPRHSILGEQSRKQFGKESSAMSVRRIPSPR